MLEIVVAQIVPIASRVKNAWWPVMITFDDAYRDFADAAWPVTHPVAVQPGTTRPWVPNNTVTATYPHTTYPPTPHHPPTVPHTTTPRTTVPHTTVPRTTEPAATTTSLAPGCSPITKFRSGVSEYMQTFPKRNSPFNAGRNSFNTGRIDHLYQDPHVDNRNFVLHYGDLTDSTSLVFFF